jgi:SAM-dependent methyltransferase
LDQIEAPAAMLAEWFDTPQGRYVLGWEQGQFDSAVDDVFGYHAVQVGLPEVDFLRRSRIPLRLSAGEDERASVRSQAGSLPFATQSIDLVVLPHVLEFSVNPHQILREAERVLMPGGSIVIAGFNPLSLWGVRRALRRRSDGYPWSGRFIGLLRLRDWLKLLGFELNGGRFGCYAPPFTGGAWLDRSRFMEKAGQRWWPIAGGVYVVRAVKHVVGMRRVLPSWRELAARRRRLAPLTQRNGVRTPAPISKLGGRHEHE